MASHVDQESEATDTGGGRISRRDMLKGLGVGAVAVSVLREFMQQCIVRTSVLQAILFNLLGDYRFHGRLLMSR